MVLHVLTMKKRTDFYSYESTECTEELSQEVSCSSQVPDKTISQDASWSSWAPNREISSDDPFRPPPAFCFPKTKMGSCERPFQSSWFQKFPWLLYNTRNHQFLLFASKWSGRPLIYFFFQRHQISDFIISC